MKVPNEVARELACMNVGATHEGLKVVENRQVGSGRWTSHHELVVSDGDGNLWSSSYEQGLTESQDTRPFDDDGDEIEFVRVNRREVVTYEYDKAA